MTYGDLRYRIRKQSGVEDLELLDGWIQDRYTEVLDELPWKRSEAESVIQVPASYQTGTVAVVQGSTSAVGTGTTFTIAMEACIIRIAAGSEYYGLTFVDATHLTLDRPYEGASNALATFRIDQNVFPLPTTARIFRGVRSFHPGATIRTLTPAELNRYAPSRPAYGVPNRAAATWDSFTDPPILQVELYPIPDCPGSDGALLSFVVDYILDADDLDATATGFSMLPWVRPSILVAGVMADARTHQENFAAADRHEERFKELLLQMKRINALQRGAQPLRMSPDFLTRRPLAYPQGHKADRDYFGEDE